MKHPFSGGHATNPIFPLITNEPSLSELQQHGQLEFHKLLRAIRPHFGASTWEAFRRFALDGLPAARLAEEMNLSENAVLRAKARILKRLREEARELLG